MHNMFEENLWHRTFISQILFHIQWAVIQATSIILPFNLHFNFSSFHNLFCIACIGGQVYRILLGLGFSLDPFMLTTYAEENGKYMGQTLFIVLICPLVLD